MGDKMLWMDLKEMNLSVHGVTVNSKGPRTKPCVRMTESEREF